MPIQKASRELKAGDTRLGLARITAEVVPLRFQTDAIQYAKQRPGNAIHQRSDIDGPWDAGSHAGLSDRHWHLAICYDKTKVSRAVHTHNKAVN